MDAGATASSVKNSSTAASDPLARNFGDPVRSAPARRARSRAIRIVSSMLFKSRACTTSSAPCPSAVRSRSTAFARYWAETGSTSFQFRARARTKSESRQATRSARSSALSTARRTATQPASGHGFRNVLAPHSTRHPSRPRTPLQPDRRSPGSFSDEAVLHRARKLTDRHPGPAPRREVSDGTRREYQPPAPSGPPISRLPALPSAPAGWPKVLSARYSSGRRSLIQNRQRRPGPKGHSFEGFHTSRGDPARQPR